MRLLEGPFPIWEIIPGKLYQRGKLHGMPPERKMRGLIHYGITHSVAFAPPTPDPDLVAWDLADIIGYTHFPISDGLLKTDDRLLEMASGFVKEINDGGCMLMMCNAGRNRSGLMSSLIVRELLGVSGVEAMELIRLHRPRALANLNFERFLESLS